MELPRNQELKADRGTGRTGLLGGTEQEEAQQVRREKGEPGGLCLLGARQGPGSAEF